MINVRDFGAVGDGVHDDGPAIQAALDASGTVAPADSGGQIVFIPKGLYLTSQTLHIRRVLLLRGEGPKASIITPAAGVGGAIVHSWASATSGWGDRSEISDVAFRALGSLPAVGIQAKARVVLRNVEATFFNGHGLEIFGSDADAPVTNANCWEASGCLFAANKGYGVLAHGSDSNAGLAARVSADNNTLGGFFDDSFLGNAWIGCHTHGNIGPCYDTHAGNTSQAIFFGCYSEVGQPKARIRPGTSWIGGNGGAGFEELGGTVFDGSTWSRMRSSDGTITAYMGMGDKHTAFAYKHADEPAPFGFSRLDAFGLNYHGMWGWGYNNNVNYTGVMMTGVQSLLRGQSVLPGYPIFPQGFMVGGPVGSSARITLGNGPPTTGYHETPDIVLNTAAAKTGDPAGWICTRFGTPGTWHPFGVLT